MEGHSTCPCPHSSSPWPLFSCTPLSLSSLHLSVPPPIPGGRPPLKATSSATVFVNLLDLNDNDPIFQNLPFVAEVLEGTLAGVSIYQVSFPFPAWDLAVCLPHLVVTTQQVAWVPSLAPSPSQGQDSGDYQTGRSMPGLGNQCPERC